MGLLIYTNGVVAGYGNGSTYVSNELNFLVPLINTGVPKYVRLSPEKERPLHKFMEDLATEYRDVLKGISGIEKDIHIVPIATPLFETPGGSDYVLIAVAKLKGGDFISGVAGILANIDQQ
jgi:hypothetical protein